jgi:hypothetical protein
MTAMPSDPGRSSAYNTLAPAITGLVITDAAKAAEAARQNPQSRHGGFAAAGSSDDMRRACGQ